MTYILKNALWQLYEKIDCRGQSRSRETEEKAFATIKANKL